MVAVTEITLAGLLSVAAVPIMQKGGWGREGVGWWKGGRGGKDVRVSY